MCGIREVAAALDGARAVPVTSLVREAMVAEPATLAASATAVEAGDRLAQPDVRAVLVTDDGGRLVGVVTRTTLVREVVAAGRDPRETPLADIAEEPRFTVDADLPVDEAFHLLEEEDLERVPVVEDGRLVGVLSRSVLQRRLAEDEPPELAARGLAMNDGSLAQVCPACGQENPEEARFCLACGEPLAEPAAAAEERKVVSVLFVDLVGFTGRSDRADPEDVRAALRPYHERLKIGDRALRRNRREVHRRRGDGRLRRPGRTRGRC